MNARVERVIERLGFVYVKAAPRREGGLPQSKVVPVASYSPWIDDAAFLRIEREIRGSTLVDRYRLWELWQLVEQARSLPEGDILELGVWRGGTGALIAARTRMLDLASEVFLCDTFAGVVKTGDKDSAYRGGEHADTSREHVEGLVERMGLAGVTILTGIFPDDTGAAIEARRFRLCHFDLDAYDSTRDAFAWVWPRLVSGGIAVFDDYGFASTGGVTRFVDEERLVPDRTVIQNLNGHAVMVKH